MEDQSQKGVARASATSIRITFYYKGKQQKEYVKCDPTEKALAHWAAKRLVIIEEIERGTFDYAKWFPNSPRLMKVDPARAMRVADILRNWLEAIEHQIELTTFRKYTQIVESVLIPALGELPAMEMSQRLVTNWRNDIPHVTRKTFSNYCSPLRLAFQHAVDHDRILEENPLSTYKVKPWRIDRGRSKNRKDPFLDNELQAALAKAQADLVPYVMFSIWTGLRMEEMIELYWEDIDLVNGFVFVQRARVKKIIKGPKTPSSERRVKLLPEAVRALDLVRPLTFLRGKHVFLCEFTAGPWSDKSLRAAWKRACLRAGVRYRSVKNFRHTYASRMLSAGESMADISKQLGHKNLSITYTAYADVLDELEQRRSQFGQAAAREYGQFHLGKVD